MILVSGDSWARIEDNQPFDCMTFVNINQLQFTLAKCLFDLQENHYTNEKIGSSEEDEVSGFFVLSHLWMRGYFRLSKG